MVITGQTIGHQGGITKHVFRAPRNANSSELVEDLKHFYGLVNVKVYV